MDSSSSGNLAMHHQTSTVQFVEMDPAAGGDIRGQEIREHPQSGLAQPAFSVQGVAG